MPRKNGNDVFVRIERIYGFVPKCLIAILRSCGFDNALALEFIDEEAIADIELHIQEAGRDLIDGLKCCNADTYKQQAVFKFTPGHKRTIFAIAEKTRDLNQKAISDRKEMEIVEIYELGNQATPGVMDSIDTSGHRSDSSLSMLKDALKASLILKLKKSIASKSQGSKTTFDFHDAHVTGWNIQSRNGALQGSCKLVCPQCKTAITATCKNGNWKVSNFVRHFESHIAPSTELNTTETAIRTAESVQQTTNENKSEKELDAATQSEILGLFDPLSSTN